MLVQGYDSDGSSDEQRTDARHATGTSAHDEESDSDSDSDSESVDSATRRSREAAARVKDYGDMQAGPTEADSSLPAASDLLGEIERPVFLDPEATRQRNVCTAHLYNAAQAAAAARSQAKAKEASQGEFDISKLAPRLKRDARDPDRGKVVLTATAKRAKTEDGAARSQLYSMDAIVAMTGGKLQRPAAAKSTKAMEVEDFLAQGVGSAQLPRRKQERKEKEKLKRNLGQSSVHGWKSEAEMVLRQQYD